ncbi:MAG: HIT domain-containing protein [Chloroflexi bacterium]|nr:HIT domain-containing protein [Chloroflexota bacterium]
MAKLSVWLARTLLRAFHGSAFTHMSFLLPVDRLRETASLVAFPHPRPAYPVHILIVPKRSIPNLMAWQATDFDFLGDLIPTVQSLVAELDLETAGYRLIANGGSYQDIPNSTFHLISGTAETKLKIKVIGQVSLARPQGFDAQLI